MMKWIAASCGAAALTFSSQSNAHVMDVEISGLITSGYNSQTFGSSSDLTGDRFTAFFRLNDDLGNLFTSGPIGAFYEYQQLSSGKTNPLILSYLEVNNNYIYSNGNVESNSTEYTDGYAFFSNVETDTNVEDYVTKSFSLQLGIDTSISMPGAFDIPFSSSGFLDYPSNYFSYSNNINGVSRFAFGYMSPDHIIIEPASISSAPEPSSWLQIILGVAGSGLMLRLAKRFKSRRLGFCA